MMGEFVDGAILVTDRDAMRGAVDRMIAEHRALFGPEDQPWREMYPAAGAPGTSNRAGAWMHPISPYPGFVPYPLPPVIEYDAELRALIGEADRALAGLDRVAQVLPLERLIRDLAAREAAAPAGIAGLVAAVSCRAVPGAERPIDPAQVLRFGVEEIRAGPITVDLIREINRRLTQGTPDGAGRYPGTFRWEIRTSCAVPPAVWRDGAPIFSPCPDEIAAPLFGALVAFMQADDAIPPLVRLALIHAEFMILHGFVDGNKRTSRMLVPLYLLSKGILSRPALGVGPYLASNQSEYHARLTAIQTDGAFEPWIKFYLKGIIEVSEEMRGRIIDGRPLARPAGD